MAMNTHSIVHMDEKKIMTMLSVLYPIDQMSFHSKYGFS